MEPSKDIESSTFSSIDGCNNSIPADPVPNGTKKGIKYIKPNFDARESPYRIQSEWEKSSHVSSFPVIYVPLDVFNTVTLVSSIVTLLFIIGLYQKFNDFPNGNVSSESFFMKFSQLSLEDRSRFIQFLSRTSI